MLLPGAPPEYLTTAEPSPDPRGRVAVVTGASSGIGLHTATALARTGARVVLAARRRDMLEAAVDTIKAQLPTATLEVAVVDLADLTAVEDFATRVGPRVDLLVNNAAVMAVPQRRLTRQGFELTMGVNHLGHFALTGLLLGALLASPAPRVVTVSAAMARRATLDVDNLDFHTGYKPFRAYAASKLANLMFAAELARRAAGTRLMSVAVHPGTTATGLQKHITRVPESVKRVILNAVLGHGTEAAARPTIVAALDGAIENGAFLAPIGRFELRGAPGAVPWPPLVDDPTARRELWVRSEQLTRVQYAI
jgi:NAD(P)-dependent dehydrogenase (short-subunit alcohol dehydrogenase family)